MADRKGHTNILENSHRILKNIASTKKKGRKNNS